MIDFRSGGLRYIGSELGAKLCHIVGKKRGLVAGTGDGDVGEARVEEVWMHFGIGVDENALGG